MINGHLTLHAVYRVQSRDAEGHVLRNAWSGSSVLVGTSWIALSSSGGTSDIMGALSLYL